MLCFLPTIDRKIKSYRQQVKFLFTTALDGCFLTSALPPIPAICILQIPGICGCVRQIDPPSQNRIPVLVIGKLHSRCFTPSFAQSASSVICHSLHEWAQSLLQLFRKSIEPAISVMNAMIAKRYFFICCSLTFIGCGSNRYISPRSLHKP